MIRILRSSSSLHSHCALLCVSKGINFWRLNNRVSSPYTGLAFYSSAAERERFTYLADKRQQIDQWGCCWWGPGVSPHNKQAHLLHKPIASLWRAQYSVSCHATRHTRPAKNPKHSDIIRKWSHYSAFIRRHGEGGTYKCMSERGE